jgi:DNA-binding GntR family transcriptional regulator
MGDRTSRPRPEIGRTQLPDEVAAYVRELIVSGQVRAGEYLRLEPIGAALGVSNTPVREGLFSLQSEGFVRLVPRRGFVVAPFSRRDLRDVFWTQGQLAGELAARACAAMTVDGLAALEANVDEFGKAVAAGDEQEATRLGHDFHRQVNRAADSRQLALVLDSVVKRLPTRFYSEGHLDRAGEAHPLVLDALRRRSAGDARAAMSAHMLDNADALIQMLEEKGMWGGG